MKGSIIAAIAGLIIIAGVGTFIVTSGDPDDSSTSTATNNSRTTVETLENPDERVTVAETNNGPVGTYTDYTEANLASATGKDKVIFFHATWCIVCKNVENNIKAGSIPENLTILEADFDEDEELRKKYEVTQQTSFVHVDDEGNLIKKWVQFDSSSGIGEILEQIEA